MSLLNKLLPDFRPAFSMPRAAIVTVPAWPNVWSAGRFASTSSSRPVPPLVDSPISSPSLSSLPVEDSQVLSESERTTSSTTLESDALQTPPLSRDVSLDIVVVVSEPELGKVERSGSEDECVKESERVMEVECGSPEEIQRGDEVKAAESRPLTLTEAGYRQVVTLRDVERQLELAAEQVKEWSARLVDADQKYALTRMYFDDRIRQTAVSLFLLLSLCRGLCEV